MVKLLVLVSLLLLWSAMPVQANWFNDINRQVRSIGAAKPVTAEPLTAAELADYPANYQFERVMAPSHQAPLFVVQAGLEHSDTVVLIHGLGDLASKDWLTVIPALAKQYHVVAIDLPGFGLSQGAVFTYSPKEYAKVIDWVINHYRHHNAQVHLVGHSMGAAISLYYASQYPGNIKQLVLVDAAGILDRTAYLKQISKRDMANSELPQGLRRVLARVDNFADKILEKTGTGFDPTKLLSRNESIRNMTIGEQTNTNAALALMEQNFSVLNYQQMPATQLIWGADDQVAPLRTAQALLHVLPTAQLKVIAGAGHVPMKSHQHIFNQLLLTSLVTPPSPRQPPPENKSHRVGKCYQDSQQYFSGQYEQLIIEDCKLVFIDNVTVNQLSISDSIVAIKSSRLGAALNNMMITRSTVSATDSHFSGVLTSTRSRFDLAGVTFWGESPVFISQESTRLVLSLVRIHTPTHITRLGGSYVLATESLESVL
ncbi:alpha/beta fold hydrolase [Shewanella livingstonensis]|uniref:Alpha/beta hydrolase n=1 Tax=Shewanella livingstonensis TaxID=150120 RepID=A0A3G8LPE5_9GAMM|nr:alpha/beta hydrolase [Shewanella livingstonensis]AZG71379.1 alpha/beta hydrolase [Shewanella livingstonensis]